MEPVDMFADVVRRIAMLRTYGFNIETIAERLNSAVTDDIRMLVVCADVINEPANVTRDEPATTSGEIRWR